MSLGMTEPDAGSALTDLKTSARADGSHYVVNGSQGVLDVQSRRTDFSCLCALRSRDCRHRLGAEIERGTPGFSIGAPSAIHERRGMVRIAAFTDCRVPAENVLLGPGGFRKQMAGFNVERLGNTARSLAYGRYAFTAARIMRRRAGSSTGLYASFRGLQWKFAPKWRSELAPARSCCSTAPPSMPTQGLPSAYETAIAKAACNLAGFEIASESGADHGRTGL